MAQHEGVQAVNGPCDACRRDSGDAKLGGGLWQPPDSLWTDLEKVRGFSTRALCSDCREDQDDGKSPWRSA